MKKFGYSPAEVQKTQQDSAKQSSFVAGELSGGLAVAYMNEAEINNPEKAKRIYQAALDNQSYANDPVMESLIKTRLSRIGGKSGAVDLTFEQQLNIPSIGRMLYGARISDKETERVQNIVTAPEAKDLDRFGLIQRILGFNLTQNQALGESLMNKIISVEPEEGLASFDMLGLAKLLNSGNTGGAIRKVENFSNSIAKKTEGDNFISESFVAANISKYNGIEKELEDFGAKLGLGVVGGSISNWLGRAKESEQKQIRAKMNSAVAKMRNELLGSAVTPAEEAFLEDVLPKTTDTAPQIASKLDNLKTNAIIELNSMRSVYGMPELNESSILDKNLKESLYLGGQQETLQAQSFEGSRTDRHNNPTALMFTPGVEKFFKDKGYNISKGDKFPESNNYTIDMTQLDDPVGATIDYIDNYTFYAPNGQQRWTHTAIPQEEWDSMSEQEKAATIKQMYLKEN